MQNFYALVATMTTTTIKINNPIINNPLSTYPQTGFPEIFQGFQRQLQSAHPENYATL
jgi:hypothetical protein